MALGILAGIGIPFITEMVSKFGEKLVGAGIKKVTGIDIDNEKLSPQDIQAIRDSEIQMRKMDIEELIVEYNQQNKEESEKTKRWESDNKSEGKFNKNIRPMLVTYLVFVSTILAILDGNVSEFTIKEVWVSLFTALTVTSVSGYFVLRSYEKSKGVHK